MDKTEKDIHDAEQAEYLLSHPLLQAAFDGIERDIFEQLAEVNMHDSASQQELLRSLKNLRRVRMALESHVNNGIVARHLLKQSKVERAKEYLGL